ncbi:hypothetical protein ACFYP4_02520 [Streptomyces sp. NPDC005551]|uniref:hypothetical protein n=1 Tax=Streptomyces sp. NPDC005551 TaxID=3364725 RepID=UPI0036BBA875
MPAVKKASPAARKPDPVMCSNHPDRPAKHTTGSELHQVISLCAVCLHRNPQMAQR